MLLTKTTFSPQVGACNLRVIACNLAELHGLFCFFLLVAQRGPGEPRKPGKAQGGPGKARGGPGRSPGKPGKAQGGPGKARGGPRRPGKAQGGPGEPRKGLYARSGEAQGGPGKPEKAHGGPEKTRHTRPNGPRPFGSARSARQLSRSRAPCRALLVGTAGSGPNGQEP
jgi:hypothetical protein